MYDARMTVVAIPVLFKAIVVLDLKIYLSN